MCLASLNNPQPHDLVSWTVVGDEYKFFDILSFIKVRHTNVSVICLTCFEIHVNFCPSI
jgi:hypothetical protein